MPPRALVALIAANLVALGGTTLCEVKCTHIGRLVQCCNAHFVIAESNFAGWALVAQFGDIRLRAAVVVLAFCHCFSPLHYWKNVSVTLTQKASVREFFSTLQANRLGCSAEPHLRVV